VYSRGSVGSPVSINGTNAGVLTDIQSSEVLVTPIMLNWIEQFSRDIRFGARGLARTPGFATLAVVSLALGIMATTTIYSVLHAVVLDPFPYQDVDKLMSVRVSSPALRGFRIGYSVDQFLEIAERNRIFDGVIASTISDVLWTGDGDPQRLRGNHGTFNTFAVMGVPPLLGRTPSADDARPGAAPVVVLGYRFWQRQFGGDPNVLGAQLQLNGNVRAVIGVMPKRFMWRGADVYLPIAFERGRIVEGVENVHLLGRLKPGVTVAEAETDLAPIIADLKHREPSQFPDRWRVDLLPFKQTFPSAITRDIWVLLGAVALLLLIACANVSNLLLSRASARQREMTVRVALGASRARLVRQLLTESLMLAVAAGSLGTVLAYAGLPALLALVPPGRIPDESEIRLNQPVLIFALLLSAATSVICGLAPALHASGRDVARSMREAGRGLAGSSRQAMVRKTLVVAEVALSLVLLAGSSVLVRTFVAMENVDLGIPPARVLTMRVPLPPQRYPDARRRVAFFQELLPRVRAVPGVAAVGLNSGLHPLGNMRATAEVVGEPANSEPVQVHQVNADYTNALGIRLAAGRLLVDADVEGHHSVALVNAQFVRTRLNGRAPLGRVVRLARLKEPPFNVENDSFQIVGVVHDKLNAGLTDPVVPEVYLPFTAAGISNLLAVRTRGDPADVTRAVVSQVYAVDRGQPVTAVMTLDQLLKDNQFATPRFNLILLSIFAAFGLMLAIVGVYGVMSSAVAQARQEIGVRMAFGAEPAAIVRMVIARGARLLLAGIAIGLAGSVAAGRWLAGEVWRVAAVDPAAFAGVSLLLLAAGLQACFWPARRAARTDPLEALREE
jgi:putative ABC transport system permease protein